MNIFFKPENLSIAIFASQAKDGYIYLWGELLYANLYSKYIAYQQLFPNAGIEMSTIDPRHIWLMRMPSNFSHIDVFRGAYGLRRSNTHNDEFKKAIKSYWDWKTNVPNNVIAKAYSGFANGDPFYLENAADGRWMELIESLPFYTNMGGITSETALEHYMNSFETHGFVIDGHCAKVRESSPA